MNYWTTVVALFSRCGEKERARFPFPRTLRRERGGGGGNGERFDYGGGGNFGSGQGVLFPPVFPFLRSGTPPPKVVVRKEGRGGETFK